MAYKDVPILARFVILRSAVEFHIMRDWNETKVLTLNAGAYQVDTSPFKSMAVDDTVSVEYLDYNVSFLSVLSGLPVTGPVTNLELRAAMGAVGVYRDTAGVKGYQGGAWPYIENQMREVYITAADMGIGVNERWQVDSLVVSLCQGEMSYYIQAYSDGPWPACVMIGQYALDEVTVRGVFEYLKAPILLKKPAAVTDQLLKLASKKDIAIDVLLRRVG